MALLFVFRWLLVDLCSSAGSGEVVMIGRDAIPLLLLANNTAEEAYVEPASHRAVWWSLPLLELSGG